MSDFILPADAAEMAHEVAFTRFYVAPPQLVFDTWTRRHHLSRWWGPEGSALTTCTIRLHPGGALQLVARDVEGREHVLDGTILEAKPPGHLLFAARGEEGPGDLLTTAVSFDPMGAMTRMTVRQTAESEAQAQRQMVVWLERLTRLSEYLE